MTRHSDNYDNGSTNDPAPGISPHIAVLGFIAVLFLVISIISFSFSIQKPFTLDEVEEARMAEKINKIGTRTFLPAPEGGGEPVSHPLLYSYTNAIFYRLFGSSEIALRSYGILFYVLSFLVMLLLVREVVTEIPVYRKGAMAVAASLYLLNPLLIQHSMLLNADNNISAFAILLYVYLFCKFEKVPDSQFLYTRFILAGVVAFNFMCKEVTPCFLFGSVIIYRLLNRNFKRLALDLICNIILGIIIFWGIWYAYCLYSGTDIMGFIKFTAARKSKKVLTIGFFLKQFRYFFVTWKWPWYWVSAPFFILVFVGLYNRIRLFLSSRRLKEIDFMAISSVCMFMPFIFVKPSIDMMKYQYPTYPLFIVLIAWLMIGNVSKNDRPAEISFPKLTYLFAAFIACWGIWYYRIGDYILILWKELPVGFLLLYYMPILIAACMFYALFRKWRLDRVVLGVLFMLIFPISIGLNLNQIRDYTTAECWLNYGEEGLRDTTLYLREHIDPSQTVSVRKDIEYYLNFRYGLNVKNIQPTPIFRMRNPNEIIDFFEKTPIQYFVFEKVSSVQRGHKDILKILNKYFFVEKRFGDFIVLRSKPRSK